MLGVGLQRIDKSGVKYNEVVKTMDCIGNVGKGERCEGYKTRSDKILFCKEVSVVT